jgi:hypothetical protein
VQVHVPAHEEECFGEHVDGGNKITGSFEVISSDSGIHDVDAAILGPAGEAHYHVTRQRQGHFTAEDFIVGHEGFYDTITVNGEVGFESISHYYPGVLESMRTRDVNPYLVVTNRLDAPGYQELRQFGRNIVKVMGIGTSATHMEWFFGPKGLTFSEIGARPPGVSVWDLYAAAGGFDIYEAWANAVCHGTLPPALHQRQAAGLLALRPERDGVISGYSGVDEIQRRHGPSILKAFLPPVGTRTQPVEAGYMANAWVQVVHPDFDVCKAILMDIGDTVKVHARPGGQ